jgi:hypothetical protein
MNEWHWRHFGCYAKIDKALASAKRLKKIIDEDGFIILGTPAKIEGRMRSVVGKRSLLLRRIGLPL